VERTFWRGHRNGVMRFFLLLAALVGFAFTSCNSGDSQTESPKVHTRWYSKQRLDHFSENDPNCHQNACSIEKVCRDYMVNDRLGQRIDRLAELLISNSAGKCTSVDYHTNTLAPLLDLDYTPDGLRAWRYQIHCKEFGFFRTCDPST
jgi:hypothetical protein